jgi:hypothetical protein
MQINFYGLDLDADLVLVNLKYPAQAMPLERRLFDAVGVALGTAGKSHPNDPDGKYAVFIEIEDAEIWEKALRSMNGTLQEWQGEEPAGDSHGWLWQLSAETSGDGEPERFSELLAFVRLQHGLLGMSAPVVTLPSFELRIELSCEAE